MESVFRSLASRESRSSASHGVRQSVLGSSHLAERFSRRPILLEGHTGCVNSIHFSECGSQIITASDDLNINFWDLSGEMINHMPTIHSNNVFCAKDLPTSSSNEIISCAADGQVVLSNVSQSKHRQLFKHKGRAYQIALVPLCPNQLYSCGEDGICCLYDVRTVTRDAGDFDSASISSTSTSCVALKTKFTGENYRSFSINCLSVSGNRPYEVAMGGASPTISVYDTRKFQSPMFHLGPSHLEGTDNSVTGLKHDYSGEGIIASYNDEDIYLISTVDHARAHLLEFSSHAHDVGKCTVPSSLSPPSSPTSTSSSAGGPGDGYRMRYKGHRNCDTVKQVTFLGSRSEMVVSGSDCGNLFIWDTESGNLVSVFPADSVGAVNSLSAHPSLPYLASSGLEPVGKLWIPSGKRRSLAEYSKYSVEAEDLVIRNKVRRSRGQTARTSLISDIPEASMMAWMEAQFGAAGAGDGTAMTRATMLRTIARMMQLEESEPESDDDFHDREDESGRGRFDEDDYYGRSDDDDDSSRESDDDDDEEEQDDDEDADEIENEDAVLGAASGAVHDEECDESDNESESDNDVDLNSSNP